MDGKSGWEKSEFPIVCETCLGDNPYVRMLKAGFDKECKICSRPFTVFHWRPGTNARYKKTEICQTCAKLQNVCQTCLLDLQYGLPVQVRDATLSQIQAIPQSEVGREWFAMHADRRIGQSELSEPYGRLDRPVQQLSKIARTSPYYKRNLAHVCSFWLKGQCTRGATCPYRHEKDDHDPSLANQNMKDRYFGNKDPVAQKILNRMNAKKLAPPEDLQIKTLFVANVQPNISEQDIRDHFYAYGEISELKISTRSYCAFVTYTTREAAEEAVNKLQSLTIKGLQLRVSWGRSHAIADTPLESDSSENVSSKQPGATPVELAQSFNFISPEPPNPEENKPFYPSMNPQQFGSKRDR